MLALTCGIVRVGALVKLPTLLSSGSGVSKPVKPSSVPGCAGATSGDISLAQILSEVIPTRHRVLSWANNSDYLAAWTSNVTYDAGTEGDEQELATGRRKRLPYDFRSCAVVGNGGIMRANALGKAVDAHTAIWRLNQAPTKGYERLVGKKTHFRVLNKTWLAKYANRINKDWLPFEPELTLVPSRGNPGTARGMFNMYGPTATQPLRRNVRVANMHSAVSAATSKVMREFRRQASCSRARKTFHGGSTPSGGIMTVFMALALCKRTTVYGFGNEPGGKYQYYQFLNTERPGGDAVHSFDAEKALVMQLAKDGYVEFCSDIKYGRGVHCGCPKGDSCGDSAAASVSQPKVLLREALAHEASQRARLRGVSQKGLYAIKKLGGSRGRSAVEQLHHSGTNG
ncbi:hypothetical protein PPROV_000852200 [Pycnococcus provasolii]|uniref:Uncharacterized protein n=1 Tax=Pycnococcus provasolii TaxID=41880 RepID=A0A830HXU1_9CHLO|nr:hypothetical protein PPROV_000852200 [Pycnococcus provasolii]